MCVLLLIKRRSKVKSCEGPILKIGGSIMPTRFKCESAKFISIIKKNNDNICD